jgi:hypothetical protein
MQYNALAVAKMLAVGMNNMVQLGFTQAKYALEPVKTMA